MTVEQVLDISEGGLRFESFAPIQEHGPNPFLVFSESAGTHRGLGRSGLDGCGEKVRRPEVPESF